jgi:hypothetical protein
MGDRERWGGGELFPTDAPIPADEMIGRVDDVDRMAQALIGGRNLVVAGPRRTGKTSVCDAALEVCAASGGYVVAVDLFYLADAASLAEALTIAALSNRSGLKRALTRAADARGRAWDLLSEAATFRMHQDLGEGGIDLELPLVPRRAEAAPAEALSTAMRLLQALAERDGKRMVVFFDEFQEITRGLYGEVDEVTKSMRAVLQRSPNVSTVFAGSIEHLMRDLFSPSDRALSQFGSFFTLAEITTDEWSAGIRERLARDGCTITDTALGRLVGLGDGHPRSTMLLAQHAHDDARAEVTREIDDGLVAAALVQAMASERLRHQQSLEQIRGHGKHAQKLAQRVALEAVLYEGIPSSVAAKTMNRLRDAGVVDQAPSRSGGRRSDWRITDPLLRRYLSELPLLGRVTMPQGSASASSETRA